jgi:DNA polymerase-3 subunit alpha
MGQTPFVHLHVHSHYSLLDGLGKVSELVAKAKELEMPALALTDHGVLHGAIDFYLECQKAGIKPIVGQEAYVAPRKLTDKSSGVDTKPYHLVLLAKNYEGYRNLIKLTSTAHLDGYYYKPRVDRDLLSRHSAGLIATSACLGSETSRLILNKDQAGLEQTIGEYKEIFGPDNYFLELQHHPSIPEQQVVNETIKKMAKQTGLGLVVTNDTHYVNAEDRVSHDLLVCIQTGRLVSDANRMVYTSDFSLKSGAEMAAAFPDTPEAVENTLKIADLVDLEIPLGQSLLPQFPLPEGQTEMSLLKLWCEEGLVKRYPKITPEIQERLDYELSIVGKTGFPGYFLIVADLIRFAHSKNIYVGPGRGSAAGSLIAYATGITNIDPLRYGLLFERFLDLNRISMPDIDMDFEDVRRKEVIDYVREKYGDDHVAGIITFGTIMARAAVRDVGRVLGVPYGQVDGVAKAVPAPLQGRHIPLRKSIGEAPELKTIYDHDAQAHQILDAAVKLEGTIRHASQHACAIVIAREPLENYVPVIQSQGGDIHQVTQYSMEPIEKIGLLKMDFLGLANLTIMRQCCDIIEAVYGDGVDINNLPLDDKKTFALLGRGETTGVFQLESAGMKRYIKELKPTRFEDIIAMVALYRPGPMQWIQSFINRKNGTEKISYLHPLAESALKETYGIPVYQEQVMQMSKDMCGFTGSEADTLRKAIGKKIPKLMKEMREKFIAGAMKSGVTEKQANDIFDQLEDFAAYCFNKSHSACYGLIAYQTAYLKANYPDCFMAALMTSDLDNTDRLSIEISESERIGLKVLPPDVNESYPDFAIVKDAKQVRFGLGAIKNVGRQVAEKIVKERKSGGPYQSLEEFLTRNADTLNKKVLDSMIRAGALDRFATRASLAAGLELVVKFASDRQKNVAANQLSMFGAEANTALGGTLMLPAAAEDKKNYLAWERELLGLYLSEHPMKQYQGWLAERVTALSQIELAHANKTVRIAGVVQEAKKITTKAQQTMAFITLEDGGGQLEVIVFPNLYQEKVALWQTDQLVMIDGTVSDKDGVVKILANKVYPLDEMMGLATLPPLEAAKQRGYANGNRTSSANPNDRAVEVSATPLKLRPLTIDLPSTVTKESVLALKTVLAAHPGPTPVELRVIQSNVIKIVPTKARVAASPELEETIRQTLLQPAN